MAVYLLFKRKAFKLTNSWELKEERSLRHLNYILLSVRELEVVFKASRKKKQGANKFEECRNGDLLH